MKDEAEIFDLGFPDYYVYEDKDGRLWISSSPRWEDGMMYEHRKHIGEDIYEILRELEK